MSFTSRTSLNVLISFSIFCHAGIQLMSQQIVRTGPPPTPLVSVMSVSDDTESSSIALRSSLPTALLRTMVIVSNHSLHSIDAISVIWKITGADGREVTYTEQCDIFFPGQIGRHVASPNARVLMGPNGCFLGSAFPSSDVIRAKHKDILGSLLTALIVDIRIVAVGFDNGDAFETSGNYISEIAARVAAAKQVSAIFRSRLKSGKDVPSILSELATVANAAPGLAGAWIRDYATSVSRSKPEHLMPRLSSLENIQSPAFVVIAKK